MSQLDFLETMIFGNQNSQSVISSCHVRIRMITSLATAQGNMFQQGK